MKIRVSVVPATDTQDKRFRVFHYATGQYRTYNSPGTYMEGIGAGGDVFMWAASKFINEVLHENVSPLTVVKTNPNGYVFEAFTYEQRQIMRVIEAMEASGESLALTKFQADTEESKWLNFTVAQLKRFVSVL